MEPLESDQTSPAAEAVDHIRFQISLLRLCSVPGLDQSVKPAWLENPEAPADSEQTRELEFMREVAR